MHTVHDLERPTSPAVVNLIHYQLTFTTTVCLALALRSGISDLLLAAIKVCLVCVALGNCFVCGITYAA